MTGRCRACAKQDRYDNYIQKWFLGEVTGNSGEHINDYVRRWVFETRGKACELCGWAEVNPKSGKVPVCIDHIDGHWENTRPENLKVLCPNHHALTSTYGALNIGNGRPQRAAKVKALRST